MKTKLPLLFLLFSMQLSAQDWGLFNPSEQLCFRMDTTELITHTLTVDSITEIGELSEYHFNRIMAACEDCEPTIYEFVVQNQPGVMGYSLIESSVDFTLVGVDQNMVLPKHPVLNESWMLTENLNATFTNLTFEQVYDVQDSVRNIELSSGQVIKWSKNFGLLQLPQLESDLHYLQCGNTTRRLGTHPLTFEEAFDFEVGDVFYYTFSGGSSESVCYGEKRFNVIDKTVSDTSFVYSIDMCLKNICPASSSYSTYSGTEEMGFYKSDWAELNSNHRERYSGMDYVPGTLVIPEEGGEDDYDYFTYLQMDTLHQKKITFLGGLFNEDVPFTEAWLDSSIAQEYDGDTLIMQNGQTILPNSMNLMEGLGIVRSMQGNGLSPFRIDLMSYQTANHGSFGEMILCDVILSVEEEVKNEVSIYFRDGQAIIESSRPLANEEVQVFNAQGQLLLSRKVSGERIEIDLNHLSTQIILVHLPSRKQSVKLIICD